MSRGQLEHGERTKFAESELGDCFRVYDGVSEEEFLGGARVMMKFAVSPLRPLFGFDGYISAESLSHAVDAFNAHEQAASAAQEWQQLFIVV